MSTTCTFCQKTLSVKDIQDHSLEKEEFERILFSPCGDKKYDLDGLRFSDETSPDGSIAVCWECATRLIFADRAGKYEVNGFTVSTFYRADSM
jgi:hypothetical protein